MENECIPLLMKMKKIFKRVKLKGTNLLSRSRSASTNNLSDTSGSLHVQELNQQVVIVQEDTQKPEFISLVDEERLEVPVINSIPLGSGDITNSAPNISGNDNDSSTTMVALQNNSFCISEVNDNDTASNADTTICLYEQPPTELVQIVDVPEDQLAVIRSEALIEANREYPIKCYDFCLVCCDEDYEIAEEIKEKLCKTFNLVGCMIENDSFMLGRDIFQAYEFMMDRSTKVMFLISDAFNRNPFNQRLQNGAVFQTLVSRIKKEKCVPVFPQGLCEVPLPLSGIAGISCRLPPQVLQARVNATYTEEVRNIRTMKEQVLLDMRNTLYNELLARKAAEHRARELQLQQTHALGQAAGDKDRLAITSGIGQPQLASDQSGTKTMPGLDSILESAGLAPDQKNSVLDTLGGIRSPAPSSIVVSGSENVSIGDKFNITVYVSPSGAAVSTTTPVNSTIPSGAAEVNRSNRWNRRQTPSTTDSSEDSTTDSSSDESEEEEEEVKVQL